MASLAGKVIGVTGGASGIGLSIAKVLTTRGAKVSIADFDEGMLHKVPSAIGTKDVITSKCDVRSATQIQDWLKRTVDQYGKLDGAANFAGVIPGVISGVSGSSGLFEDQNEDDWNRVIGINLTGLMLCMREQLRLMKSGSSIVNAASVAGIMGLSGTPAYGASKHGVVGLTRNAAVDYGQKGIRVNAVAPGYVDTPLTAPVASEMNQFVRTIPLGRTARPEEIANVAVFLLSDEASYITGQIYPVCGGWHV